MGRESRIRISGMLGTLEALWEVFPLFTNTGWGESANLDFLKKHMGAKFEVRPEPWVTNVNVDEKYNLETFLQYQRSAGYGAGLRRLRNEHQGRMRVTPPFAYETVKENYGSENPDMRTKRVETLLLCYHGRSGGTMS